MALTQAQTTYARDMAKQFTLAKLQSSNDSANKVSGSNAGDFYTQVYLAIAKTFSKED